MPDHEGGRRDEWTVRLEARTSKGKVKTTELVTFRKPGVAGTLAGIGLMLAEAKTLLAKLQASMLCGQVAAYAAHHRVCAAGGVLQPLKDRRMRRLQTLFGTVEVEAPRFKVGPTQHSRRQPQSSTGQLTKTGHYVTGPEDRRGRIRLGRF